MCRLYVPYWLFDCDARADIVYDAQTTTTEQEGEWEVSGHETLSGALPGTDELETSPWMAA